MLFELTNTATTAITMIGNVKLSKAEESAASLTITVSDSNLSKDDVHTKNS